MTTKYTMKDQDKERFEVGYKLYEGLDTDDKEPQFYFETDRECFTLHLTPVQLRKLIEKMEKLCKTMENKLTPKLTEDTL
jgi:DNA-directed RNA polymerase subunit L